MDDMADSSYEIYTPAERRAPENAVPEPRDTRHTEHTPVHPRGCFGSSAVERFVVVSTICIAIWLMTGAGYFWPGWVMLGTGIPVVLSMTGRGTRRGHVRR